MFKSKSGIFMEWFKIIISLKIDFYQLIFYNSLIFDKFFKK
ncbi:hypothetical protein HMPREF1983_00518 [Gemella bergeri ATCC 700627]|uniref:Uncharacterized protein n=1 Tax=Gemella bergeri ATCC 700627 TaxID=1321820 RepID=U2QTJ8_9BACL|nr:hypothetical protein HMPREF1983_00518 [Gemella bergeri ATCC 700627]